MLEAQSTLFVLQTTRTGNVVVGNHKVVKLSMYCISCHRTNHNVATCKNKKEEPTITAIEATIQVGKPPRPPICFCHICGIMGYKLTNYPIWQHANMFKDKKRSTHINKPISKVKTVIASINMADVNVTIHSKTSEE